MKRAVTVAVSIPLLLVTAWWTLALVFAGPDPAWLRTGLAAVYALGTLGVLLWLRPFTRALGVWVVALIALLIWWNTIRPSNDRRLAARCGAVGASRSSGRAADLSATFETSTTARRHDFTPHYEDRTYDLSTLRGVDGFIIYWGSPAIAHTIMSWQFENALPHRHLDRDAQA